MSFRVETVSSGLCDANRPRRFDPTMSRRTRRPASSATNFHQDQDAKLNAGTPSQCLCLSDHLQSGHSEDAEVQQQQQQQQECQDDSFRRFSLLELIEDETTVDGEKDPAAVTVVQGVAEAAAASLEHVPGRRVFGMMRRYVRVRSINTKNAAQKNVAPI